MIKKPFVGQKDIKVSVFELQKTVNSIGEPKEEEVLLFETWAHLKTDNGTENEDGKIIHLVDRVYVVRYRSNLLAEGTQFILRDAHLKFQIEHVRPLGRKDHLELICKAYE